MQNSSVVNFFLRLFWKYITIFKIPYRELLLLVTMPAHRHTCMLFKTVFLHAKLLTISYLYVDIIFPLSNQISYIFINMVS